MGVGQDLVRLLARDADRSFIPELARQLRTGARGRAAAAFLLGELLARESAGDLAAALDADPGDVQVTVACIEALGKLADPAAVPALTGAARHHLALVRAAALLALSKIDHPDVSMVALATTDDFDPDVRERAVRVLAARGGPDATARLLAFCDGPHARVALRGLTRIADERAVPALIRVLQTAADKRTRQLAGQALARSARNDPGPYLGPTAQPAQASALAWVLGEVGDTRSSRQLSRLLHHRDEPVRARAAAALGKIADLQAAPGLHTALRDISPACAPPPRPPSAG
jgi:HEAT repeat protein